MSTEGVSQRYLDLDMWSAADQIAALYEGQLAAVAAIGPALPGITLAVEQSVPRLRQGGRIVYAGAGTSARIAVQDGAELLPTFNWPIEQVAFAIAGGEEALLRAVEDAEDSASEGERRMIEIGVGANDVVLGVAASGSTPYTVAAVTAARARGAFTVGISNNAQSTLLAASECPVLIETGPEAIAGSTRLKAGTAQKIALNLYSTAVMAQLGRVYRGMMVDMRPTNSKLRQRAERMVAQIGNCSPEAAADALSKGGANIKLASLIVNGLGLSEASELLAKHGGNLRAALNEARS